MKELRGKMIKDSQILNIHFCTKSVEKEVGESWPNLQTFLCISEKARTGNCGI